MVVDLSLQTDEQGRVVPAVQGQALAEPTLLTSIPSLEVLQADPFSQGRAQTAALDGDVGQTALCCHNAGSSVCHFQCAKWLTGSR